MALIIAFLVLDRFVLTQDAGIAEPATVVSSGIASETVTYKEIGPSVAVLPFVNMSEDKANEYLSDGLTETLLHMLSQLPGLRVAARTSSFAFKGQNKDVAEIADALGVAHILEGSVQKADDRIRVTAQ
jgi:TolB-like protein